MIYADTKRRLDGVSPSFCAAKWLQVSLHLYSGQTHSCHHPPSHTIPLSELENNPSALHNTAFKKSQRKLMLEGKRPEECSYCWSIEDTPGDHFSDRIIKSSDDWASSEIERLAKLRPEDHVNPRYAEVSFSSACNFKCSYCFPYVSSRIMEEYQKYGPYDISTVLEDPAYKIYPSVDPKTPEEHSRYVQAFWDWWPNLYPDLRVLRITGGEPLLSPSTFRVFDKILESPNPLMELSINSNFGVPESLMDRLVIRMKQISERKCLRQLRLYTSIDTWGRDAEYIRYGLKFEDFWRNVERVLRELPEVHLTLMCTFNSLSIPSFERLLKGVLEIKKQNRKTNRSASFSIDISLLTNPPYQSVLLLPKDWLEPRVEGLVQFMDKHQESATEAGFSEHERNKLRRILHMISNQVPANKSLYMGDFFRFFKEHDRRRDTDFLNTFPELKKFWESCRQEHVLQWFKRKQ